MTDGLGDSFIFSTPSAKTTSACPDEITSCAILTAALPEEHAASTLRDPALSPRAPDTETAGSSSLLQPPKFETTVKSTSPGSMFASLTASRNASHASSIRLASWRSPNLVLDAPIIPTLLPCNLRTIVAAWIYSCRTRAIPPWRSPRAGSAASDRRRTQCRGGTNCLEMQG